MSFSHRTHRGLEAQRFSVYLSEYEIVFRFLVILFAAAAWRGEWIVINNVSVRHSFSHSYNETRFWPSGLIGIIDTQGILKANKVKSLIVFSVENNTHLLHQKFHAAFDTVGRMIAQYKLCENENFAIKQDSFFSNNKIIITTKIVNQDGSVALSKNNQEELVVDSITIAKQSFFYDGDSIVTTIRTNKIYIEGSTINSRNEYYNSWETYMFDYDYRLPKPGVTTYNFSHIKVPTFYKTNYDKDKRFICKMEHSISAQYLKKDKPLNYKEMKRIPFLRKKIRKVYTRYFIDGESVCEPIQMKDFRVIRLKVLPEDEAGTERIITRNKRGLADTFCIVFYAPQMKNKPCVKPASFESELYLKVFSGNPSMKIVDYIIRYEYFDE